MCVCGGGGGGGCVHACISLIVRACSQVLAGGPGGGGSWTPGLNILL